MFCLCGAEAEPACVSQAPGACSAAGRGSEPLRLQRVPEAWRSLPSPLPLSSQHRSEVAETVVNSSLEFMGSFFSRACSSLTDHPGETGSSRALSRGTTRDQRVRGSHPARPVPAASPLARAWRPTRRNWRPALPQQLVQPERFFLCLQHAHGRFVLISKSGRNLR